MTSAEAAGTAGLQPQQRSTLTGVRFAHAVWRGNIAANHRFALRPPVSLRAERVCFSLKHRRGIANSGSLNYSMLQVFFGAIIGCIVGVMMLLRRLPRQNVIALTCLVVFASAIAESTARKFQLPYSSKTNEEIFSRTGLTNPLLWLALTLLLRELFRYLFHGRKGTFLYAVATVLGSSFVVATIWHVLLQTPAFGIADFCGRVITAPIVKVLI